MTLTDRLAKIAALDANCNRLKERRDRRRDAHQGISYVQWQLVMARMKQIRAEMRLERQQRKVA